MVPSDVGTLLARGSGPQAYIQITLNYSHVPFPKQCCSAYSDQLIHEQDNIGAYRDQLSTILPSARRGKNLPASNVTLPETNSTGK